MRSPDNVGTTDAVSVTDLHMYLRKNTSAIGFRAPERILFFAGYVILLVSSQN